jgi:hypothetical protein
VDGVCSIPTTHYSCIKGTSENPSETASSWSWDCAGSNNGATVSCTESKFNGRCSSTLWGCTLGSVDLASKTGGDSGPWTWTCKGFNRGSDASCAQSNDGGAAGYSCNSNNQCVATMGGIYSDSTCNSACGGGQSTTCPDGRPIPPGGCSPVTETTTNGECAPSPVRYPSLCTKGTASAWNTSNPATYTWDCIGSGPGSKTVPCSQDVVTLCVDRSLRLCSFDQSYSFYKECGIEKGIVPCSYGCLSGYCKLPGAINVTKFEVKPALAKRGTSTRVYWNVENAPSCTVTSSATGVDADSWTTNATWPDTNSSGTNGRQSKPIQGHTMFTLHCTPLPGGPSLADVIQTRVVDIAPIFQER